MNTALPHKSTLLIACSCFFFGCVGSVTVLDINPDCNFDPEEFCNACDNQSVYYCDCIDLSGQHTPVVNENDPCSPGSCAACPGQTVGTEYVITCPQPGVPTEGAYSCSGWDPDSLISSPSSNNYAVDSNLVSALEYDITPLYECDSARINVNSGNLVVQSAVSTDMAYLLGLRNGDTLVEVNGMSLADPAQAVIAYMELWLNQGEDSYTLKVLRGGNYVYLNYGIIIMSP